MLKWIRDTFLLILMVLVIGYVIGSLYGGSFDVFQWEKAARTEIATGMLGFIGLCVYIQIMRMDNYE